MLDRAILAKIHVAKKQLAMEDDAYRAMLQSVAGVQSAKDLTVAQADKVLSHLRKCGFTPAVKFGRRPAPPRDRQALVSKIEALLAEGKRPWSYADALARRMFQVDKIDWCTPDQLWRIAAALQIDANRHGG
ncbi:regulatory protein GemA [Cupriavidus taiwanensis]|uniref:gp16 family protein n=1 Tax=Cupriavidus taiwanensis TaxID=164546 RepID=UPI0025414538|nr:regulatory protein GemA [Cupriavidus taiwanensis]MDK3025560.1 regulatory protein GemA [Cupriavidus taiwanensis]